jgi:hypothetical protein
VDTRRNLQRARIASGLDLSRVSAITALSPAVVRKIDDGRFEELPGGLYARSYIRAFADAVGVSPETALKDVEPFLPGAPDPLPTLREKSGRTPGDLARACLKNGAARARTMLRQADASMLEQHGLDVRRGGAAVVDAVLLASIGASTTALTAWMCGVGFVEILDQAGLALAVMLILPVLLYFVLFQGIGGRTPGARLCGLPRRDEPRKLRLDIIATRAFRT